MNSKRTALVTGGSRGVGLAVAQHLARAGFDLIINGRRPRKEVQEAVESTEKLGAVVMYCQADVSHAEDRAKLIADIRGQAGRLDVLVNNAGIASPGRTDILEATEESFDQVIDVNLKGPYFLTQQAAKWMIEQRQADAGFKGCIVNIGSVSATVVSVNRGDYCISKAGVAMATQLWAARLTEFGIDVFEIRPGLVETDMTAPVKSKYDKLLKQTDAVLEKRWGKPDDVGRAVAMLAGGQLTYAPGQVLTLDGGMTMVRL